MPRGEVYPTEAPGGEAAVAIHRGPYNRIAEAHNAIEKWMLSNRRQSARCSWEIYGDPTPDPADTETTVVSMCSRQRSAGPRLHELEGHVPTNTLKIPVVLGHQHAALLATRQRQ
jgi:GyrI-like small molecule binding protein